MKVWELTLVSTVNSKLWPQKGHWMDSDTCMRTQVKNVSMHSAFSFPPLLGSRVYEDPGVAVAEVFGGSISCATNPDREVNCGSLWTRVASTLSAAAATKASAKDM